MPRLNLPTLAQAWALGLDIGGNATLVGVSGNVKEGSRLFIQE
jgi:Na+/H+ antiporter NhaD/arsenite permease-like protein